MSISALPPLPFGIPTSAVSRSSRMPELPAVPPTPHGSVDRPMARFSEPLRSEQSPRMPQGPGPSTTIDPLPRATAGAFTDRDLADALSPLIATGSPAGAPFASLEDFEAAIRSAFRRTFAQHAQSPFDPPDFLRRALWRFDALVSSRSYEETLDRKIHRFRIEEIHLLDRKTLGLISFASVKPSRHADARKVQNTVGRIAAEVAILGDDTSLPFGKQLQALIRPGELTIMAALVRGQPDPLTAPDLDYALRRIEKTFREAIANGDPLLQEIQPLLEECLLIHSPVAPFPN